MAAFGQPASTAEPASSAAAIAIHPQNPKYFLFRGKPLVLLTATEHYGSVINRPFDFERYLADAADKKQTLTRTFVLFREQQSSRNPASPCKPESPDYLAPYPRVGPGKAQDGEPVYDLDQWNAEYFQRLHRFLTRASELGIIVELTLFSNTYGDPVWALNPLKAENNLQKVGAVAWQDYNSLRNAPLNERQFALARKIVAETNRYDNLYYEICNEPGAGFPDHASPADIDAWQEAIAEIVRSELRQAGRKHLVFASQAFSYTPKFHQPLDATFTGALADGVNVHPLPDTILGGRTYMMGNFMSKELKLSEVADFCRASQKFPKPCVLDEDNAASIYRDPVGWTIHRKRAWIAAMSQCHYDYIDFSITVGSEAGTKASSAGIRTWMKHLSEFIHGLDFVQASPQADVVAKTDERLVTATLGKPGQFYAIYLADAREVVDPRAGEPIAASVTLKLPEGSYRARLFSPTSGGYSPAVSVPGGSVPATLDLGQFQHDLVVHLERQD